MRDPAGKQGKPDVEEILSSIRLLIDDSIRKSLQESGRADAALPASVERQRARSSDVFLLRPEDAVQADQDTAAGAQGDKRTGGSRGDAPFLLGADALATPPMESPTSSPGAAEIQASIRSEVAQGLGTPVNVRDHAPKPLVEGDPVSDRHLRELIAEMVKAEIDRIGTEAIVPLVRRRLRREMRRSRRAGRRR